MTSEGREGPMFRIWIEGFSRIVTRGAAVASKGCGSSRLRPATPRESRICEDVVNDIATARGLLHKRMWDWDDSWLVCSAQRNWPRGKQWQLSEMSSSSVSVACSLKGKARPFCEFLHLTEGWKGSHAWKHRLPTLLMIDNGFCKREAYLIVNLVQLLR